MPNKYYIQVVSNKFDGSKWSVAGFGIGNISSYNYEIEVCKTKHSITPTEKINKTKFNINCI